MKFSRPNAAEVTEYHRAGVSDPWALVRVEPWTRKQKEMWARDFYRLTPEAKVSLAEERTEVAEFAEKPVGLRDVGAGIQAGVGDITSMGLRAVGKGVEADELNRELQRKEQIYSQADSKNEVARLLQSGVRGATRSIVTMAPILRLGGGAKLLISGFAASRANQAITEAESVGLRGREKWGYVGKAAAIEGGIAGAFQAVGLGGFETIAAKGLLRSALTKKGAWEIFKHFGYEIAEENLTEFADAYNQQASKVDGPLTKDKAWEIFKQTTVTTAIAMGTVAGYRGVQKGLGDREQAKALAKRKELVEGLATKWGWPEEVAERVVSKADKASEKNSERFLDVLGREASDENRLSIDGLSEWVVENEEKARALAKVEAPSRKDFAKAGLPERDWPVRKETAGRLNWLLGQLDSFSQETETGQPPIPDPATDSRQLIEGEVERLQAQAEGLPDDSPVMLEIEKKIALLDEQAKAKQVQPPEPAVKPPPPGETEEAGILASLEEPEGEVTVEEAKPPEPSKGLKAPKVAPAGQPKKKGLRERVAERAAELGPPPKGPVAEAVPEKAPTAVVAKPKKKGKRPPAKAGKHLTYASEVEDEAKLSERLSDLSREHDELERRSRETEKEAKDYARKHGLLVTRGPRAGKLKKSGIKQTDRSHYDGLVNQSRQLSKEAWESRSKFEDPLRARIGKANALSVLNDENAPHLSRLAARLALYELDAERAPHDLVDSVTRASESLARETYGDATEYEVEELAKMIHSRAIDSAKQGEVVTAESIRRDAGMETRLDVSTLRQKEVRAYGRGKNVYTVDYGLHHKVEKATGKKLEAMLEVMSREDVATAKKLIDAESRRMAKEKKEEGAEAEKRAKERRPEEEASQERFRAILEGDLSGRLTDLRARLDELRERAKRDTLEAEPRGTIDPKPIQKKVPRVKDTLRAIESHAHPDVTRYAMHGVRVDTLKGKKVAVATDGKRLIMVPYDGSQEAGQTLKRKKGKDAGYEKIDGHFPPFDEVIPDRAGYEFRIKVTPELAAKLRGAVRAGSVVGVKTEVLAYVNLGDKDVVANAAYLLDGIEALTKAGHEPVEILIKAPDAAVLVTTATKDAVVLVMPLNTQQRVPDPSIGELRVELVAKVAKSKGKKRKKKGEKGVMSAPEGRAAPREGRPKGEQDTLFATEPKALPVKAPSKGKKAEGGVQHVEVIDTMKRLWKGLSIRGPATFKRSFKLNRAVGRYTESLGEIRLKDAYDVVTALHELGHHFDRELAEPGQDRWSSGRLPPGIAVELDKLGRDLYDEEPPNGFKSEGMAEFTREYLSGARDLQRRAPHLYAWWTTEHLAQNPEEAKKAYELEQQIGQYLNQDPQQAIEALMRPTKRGWTDGKIAAWAGRWEARWRDALLPLLRGMQRTGADLVKLAPRLHPYMLATYFARTAPGRTKHAALAQTTDVWGRPDGEGLRDAINPVLSQGEAAFRDWQEMMIAGRALTRYWGNKDADGEPAPIDPGISEADAQAIYDKHKDRPGFQEAAKGFTSFAHRSLGPLVESGAMTKEEREKIEDMNPIYAPMMRRMESEGGQPSRGGKGKAVHRVKGGGKLPVHDPVDAMLVQYERIMQVAMQAMVTRSLVQFYYTQKGDAKKAAAVSFMESPEDIEAGHAPFVGQLLSEIPAPIEATGFSAREIKSKLLKHVTGKSGEEAAEAVDEALEGFWDERLVVFKSGKDYKGREASISVVINGKRRFFEVQPDLLPILEGVTQASFLGLGGFGKLVRGAVRLQRLGATGLNAAFGLIRNPLRDTQTAAVTGDYHFHTPVVSTIRGSIADIANSKYAELYNASGQPISGRVGQDIEAANRLGARLRGIEPGGPVRETVRTGQAAIFDVKGAAKKLSKGEVIQSAKQAYDAFSTVLEGIRNALSHSEVGPRLMEYGAAHKQAMDDWGDERDAMVLAGCAGKDVTVNFSRAGSIGRQINEVVLFYNASFQSADKLLRTFGVLEAAPWAKYQQRHKNAARALAKSSVYLTSTALLLYYMFRDEDWWKELPAHEKWGYFHLGKDVRIPLPFEAGSVFGALPVAALEEERLPGALNEALEVAFKGAMPVDVTSLHGVLRNVALLGPIADVVANEDWKGAPIVPESVERHRVPSDQYGPRVTGLARDIGAHFPTQGGYSPAKIEHILNGYTAGLYRKLAGALETMADPSAISLEDPSSLPIIGTLFMRPGTSRVVGEFYARIEWLKQRKGSKVATAEEIGELAQASQASRDLQKIWASRREAITSAKTKGEIRKEAEALLLEAQERIRVHNRRAKTQDRTRGLGRLLYSLTDPSAEGGELPAGLGREEAVEALRVEAQRLAGVTAKRKGLKRAKPVRTHKPNKRYTAFGRRRAKLLKAFGK